MKNKMNFLDYKTKIIDEDDFQRLKNTGDEAYVNMSYKDFLIWNVNCIYELEQFDEIMLRKICEHIHKEKLVLVDMEHFGEFHACGFYFNMQKKLCIAHPR